MEWGAAALLRLAATTVGRSDKVLGAFYRRLAGRVGTQKAVTATVRKIAVVFYNARALARFIETPEPPHMMNNIAVGYLLILSCVLKRWDIRSDL